MKRWIRSKNELAESPKAGAFIKDIIEVYQKHGLAISHEDFQGSFEIVLDDSHHRKWLANASDDFTK